MDNILFIGNGFDLHNGMKTSYTDYLESLHIPKSYANDMTSLIEIHRGFNILSSVEIGFNTNINSIKHEYLEEDYPNEKIIINTFNTCSKFKEFDLEVFEIISNYYTLRLENFNDNIKIYFNDFDNINKFYILKLVSICLSNNLNFFSPNVYFRGRLFEKNFDIQYDFDFEYIQTLDYRETLKKILPYSNNYNYFSLYLELIRTYPKHLAYRTISTISELTENENWMNIENILYHNQFPHFQSKISNSYNRFENTTETLFMYRNFIKLFDRNVDIYDDFELFKDKFSKYIEYEQEKITSHYISVKNLLTNINDRFSLTKIYNFNYSNYINPIFKKVDENILIDNIHGNITDGKNIVFGSNHYLFLNDLTHYNDLLTKHNKEDYINQKELHYKFTKFYQLLNLSGTRQTMKIKSVTSLTILGNSIGRQDFEYFHTIINTNPQEIELNIIWSTFKNNKGEKANNLEQLTEAVYEMLESYKDLYQDITVHRMILENRIKFIHLDDFIEENAE